MNTPNYSTMSVAELRKLRAGCNSKTQAEQITAELQSRAEELVEMNYPESQKGITARSILRYFAT